jgi:hypothetical protein
VFGEWKPSGARLAFNVSCRQRAVSARFQTHHHRRPATDQQHNLPPPLPSTHHSLDLLNYIKRTRSKHPTPGHRRRAHKLKSASSGTFAIMALDTFFNNKIESMKLEIIQGQAVLRRLEAQRNEYNSRVRLLREELGLLQQPGSYVGEVVKVMGTKKVLVKVHPEGKYGKMAQYNFRW